MNAQTMSAKYLALLMGIVIALAAPGCREKKKPAPQPEENATETPAIDIWVVPEKNIWQAANDGDLQQIRLNIAREVEINKQNSSGFTPLQLAALHGYTEAASLLLENGADVNFKGEEYGIPRRGGPRFIMRRGMGTGKSPFCFWKRGRI